MRKTILSLTCFLILFSQNQKFIYTVDLSQHTVDDLFHVTLELSDLSEEDDTFSFVAFAPGVHQVLNFGRFIESFKAFDSDGNELDTEKDGINDWKIDTPEKLAKIVYEMQDSFDYSFEKNVIYPMSGTGIEPKYVVINTHGVFGYFKSHRNRAVELKLKYPDDWILGTALDRKSDHHFFAESFYQLADSPILLGDLTKAVRKVGDIDVEAYVYWPNKEIHADTILKMAEPILQSAYEFIKFSPVKRYAFLMYFYSNEDSKRNQGLRAGGALEHSTSSTYSLPAQKRFLGILPSIIAHEFMHILTPLNLRSEIIDQFDYSKATSEDIHVWLYEGVTEWVAQTMQMRSGLITLPAYLNKMSGKITNATSFDPDYSLVRISQEWMTEEGNKQYGNIYQKGALTAMALDLELLRLSKGKRGLREVYIDLINNFGRSKPFKNDDFFKTFVSYSYPEIELFIENYIDGTEPIDYRELFQPYGINLIPERPSKNTRPLMGVHFGNDLVIRGFAKEYIDFGLERGDKIIKLLGQSIDQENMNEILEKKDKLNVGDNYDIVVSRDGELVKLTGKLFQRMEYNILEIDSNSSEQAKLLRKIWTNYLQQ